VTTDTATDAAGPADTPSVTHDPGTRRFTLSLGEDRVGLLDYEVTGIEGRRVWHLTHTVVRRDMRNRGLASDLVGEVVSAARREGASIRPVCPYVVTWLRRHPGNDDLVV
jgi:predicted GNAT family acetyltransferase